MKHVREWLRAPLSCWVWFEICSVASLGLIAMALVRLVTFPWDKNRAYSGFMFRKVAVVAIWLCPMWRFRLEAPSRKDLPSPLVVVSNHVSHLDPFFISFLSWEMKWLAKDALFRFPVLGQLLRLAGDIPLIRGDRASAQRALARCGEYLRDGMPVFIFPEGTRSVEQALRPFKVGAFRLAIENQAFLLPLAITGTRQALPKHAWRFNYAEGRLRVGTPISTDGLSENDAPALAIRAQRQIEAMLADMAADAPAETQAS